MFCALVYLLIRVLFRQIYVFIVFSCRSDIDISAMVILFIVTLFIRVIFIVVFMYSLLTSIDIIINSFIYFTA